MRNCVFLWRKIVENRAFLLAKSTPEARLFWNENSVPQFFPRDYFFSDK
jgi:hypothetical protein